MGNRPLGPCDDPLLDGRCQRHTEQGLCQPSAQRTPFCSNEKQHGHAKQDAWIRQIVVFDISRCFVFSFSDSVLRILHDSSLAWWTFVDGTGGTLFGEKDLRPRGDPMPRMLMVAGILAGCLLDDQIVERQDPRKIGSKEAEVTPSKIQNQV